MVFALFNVLWATLFLEEWKRRGAEFAYKWGTLDAPAESIEEPRPQFRVRALRERGHGPRGGSHSLGKVPFHGWGVLFCGGSHSFWGIPFLEGPIPWEGSHPEGVQPPALGSRRDPRGLWGHRGIPWICGVTGGFAGSVGSRGDPQAVGPSPLSPPTGDEADQPRHQC